MMVMMMTMMMVMVMMMVIVMMMARFWVSLQHRFGPDRNIDKSQVFAKIFYRSGAQEEFLCLRSDLGSSLTRSLGQVYSLHSDVSMLCSDHY